MHIFSDRDIVMPCNEGLQHLAGALQLKTVFVMKSLLNASLWLAACDRRHSRVAWLPQRNTTLASRCGLPGPSRLASLHSDTD